MASIIENIYNAASEDYDLGTLDTFKQDMSNAKTRRTVYDTLKDDYDLGEWEQFSQTIDSDLGTSEKRQSGWKTAGLALSGGILRALEGLGRGFDQLSSGMVIEAPYGSDKSYIQNPTNKEKREAAEKVKAWEEEQAKLPEEERKKQQMPTDVAEAYGKSTVTRGLDKIEEIGEKASKAARKNVGDANFTELIGRGRVRDALELGMITALESAPQMAMGMNVPGRILLGTSVAADEYDRLTKERPDMSETARVTQAVFSGALEQFFESRWNPLKLEGKFTKGAITELIKSGGKRGGKELAKDLGKVLKSWGIDAAGEGLEEVLTTMSTDAVKYIIGWMDEDGEGFNKLYEEASAEAAKQGKELSKNDFRLSIAEGILNDFIGGAMAGGYMGGASHTIQGIRTVKANIKADEAWDKLPDSEKSRMIEESEIMSEALSDWSEFSGLKRKTLLRFLDEAAENLSNGEDVENAQNMLNSFQSWIDGVRERRSEQSAEEAAEAQQDGAQTPEEAAAETPAETPEAPKKGKGVKENKHEVTMSDGSKVYYTGTNVVYNEDGSINWEQSGNIFFHDANGDVIVGDHEGIKSSIDEALKNEKENSQEPVAESQESVVEGQEQNVEGQEQVAEVQEVAEEQPAVEKTPEEIAAEEAAAAEAAEQQRIQEMYAQMQAVVEKDGVKAISKFTPEQKFVWTMMDSGIEAALEDANAYLEQASEEKDPTIKRYAMKQWQDLIDKYGPKEQKNEEILPENLVDSEKNSNFAAANEGDSQRLQVNITQNAGEDKKKNRLGALNEQDRTRFKQALDTLRKKEPTDEERAAAEATMSDITARRKTQMEAMVAEALKDIKGVSNMVVNSGVGVYTKMDEETQKPREVVEYTFSVEADVTPESEEAFRAAMAMVAEVSKQDSFIISYPEETVENEKHASAAQVRVKLEKPLTPTQAAVLTDMFSQLGIGLTVTENEISSSNFTDYSDEDFNTLCIYLLNGFNNGDAETTLHNARAARDNGDIRALESTQGVGVQSGSRIWSGPIEARLNYSTYYEAQQQEGDIRSDYRDVYGTGEPAYTPSEGRVPGTDLSPEELLSRIQSTLEETEAAMSAPAASAVVEEESQEPEAEGQEEGETVDLTADDVVLMRNRGNSQYVFCRKGEDGKLIRLDNGKELDNRKGGYQEATGENGFKEIVVYNGARYYMLGSTSNSKTVNLVPVETTLPVNTNTLKSGNRDSIVVADKNDVFNEEGSKRFEKNNREKKLDDLLKNAKTVDDVLDYGVLDRNLGGGKKYVLTLRELLDKFSVIDSNGKRKYVGDKRYESIFDSILVEMGLGEEASVDKTGNGDTVRDEIEFKLRQRLGEGARAWNQLEKDNMVNPGKTLTASLRNFVKALAANAETPDVADVTKDTTLKGLKGKKEVNEKRRATAEDFAKRDELRERLKNVATPEEMHDINEEIMKLMSEVDFSQKPSVEEVSEEPKVESKEPKESPKEEAKDEAGDEELNPIQLLERERDRAVEQLDLARKRGNKDMEEMLLEKINDLGKRIFEAKEQSEFDKGEGGATGSVVREAGARVVDAMQKAGIEAEVIDEAQLPDVLSEKEVQELKTSKGVVYGLKKGKKIYIVRERMNPNTPIHEYGHLWVDVIRKEDAKLWKGIKTLLKDTKMWQEVLNDTKYAKIHGNEEMMASEVMSRLLGMRFGEVIDESGKTRFDELMEQAKSNKEKSLLISLRKKIDEFVIKVLGMFGIEIKSEKRFWNMVDKVLHMPMEDLARWSAAIEDMTSEESRERFNELMATYHGTTANFDKFDFAFMGSGEGAQAYGWGGYVSKVKDVAISYAKADARRKTHSESGEYAMHIMKGVNTFVNFADYYIYDEDSLADFYEHFLLQKTPAYDEMSYILYGIKEAIRYSIIYQTDPVETLLVDINSKIGVAKDFLEDDIQTDVYGPRLKNLEVLRDWLKEHGTHGVVIDNSRPMPRRLYTVEIPDDNGDNYLAWNRKLTEKQQEMLANVIDEFQFDPEELKDMTGEEVYDDMVQAVRFARHTGIRIKGYTGLTKENYVLLAMDADRTRLVNMIVEGFEEDAYNQGIQFDGDNAAYLMNKEMRDIRIKVADSLVPISKAIEAEITYIREGIGNDYFSEKDRPFYTMFLQWLEDNKKNFYQEIAPEIDRPGVPADQVVSEYLYGLGFVGNKVPVNYLHSHGKDRGDSQMNYILFNDEDMHIVEKTEFDVKAETGNRLTKEEEAIKAEAEERGDYMKAPDGTPTKLTEKQWCQVRTEAFKRWAGDWQNGEARVFLDKNGEPKVLYHGTRNFGFRSFDISKSTSADAIFFADSEDIAKGYAGLMSKISHLGEEKKAVTTQDVLDVLFSEDQPLGHSINLIAAYADANYEYDEDGTTITITPMNTQDPFSIYIPGTTREEARKILEDNLDMDTIAMEMTAGTKKGGIYATFVRAENVLEIDAEGKMWDEIPPESIPGYPNTGERRVDTNGIAAWAKDQGYDGIIVRNTWDSAGEDLGVFSDKLFDEYISLRDKGDIKSATDNNGTFDETNEDIEYQLGEEEGSEEELNVEYYDEETAEQNEPKEDSDDTDGTPEVDGDVNVTYLNRKRFIDRVNEDIRATLASVDGLNLGATMMTKAAERVRQVADKTHPILMLQKSIEAFTGSKLPFKFDIRNRVESKNNAYGSFVERFSRKEKKNLSDQMQSICKFIEKHTSLLKQFGSDLLNYEEVRKAKEEGKPVTEQRWELDAWTLIERYLIACESMERKDFDRDVRGEETFEGYMGITMEEYRELFESTIGPAKAEQLWDAIRACTDISLEYALRYGIIDQASYDAYKLRRYYIPEMNFANDRQKSEFERKANKWHSKKRPLAFSHKAEGGKSLADNIIAQVVFNTQDAVSRALDNDVKVWMAKLLDEQKEWCSANGFQQPKRIWYVKDANGKYVRTTEAPSEELLAEQEEYNKLSRELEHEVKEQRRLRKENREKKRELRKQLKALDKSKKAERDAIKEKLKALDEETKEIDTSIKSLLELLTKCQKQMPIGRSKIVRDAERDYSMASPERINSTVTYFVNGDAYEMFFGGIEPVALCLNNVINTDWTVEIVRDIAAHRAAILTSYNMSFSPVNIIRDSRGARKKGFAEAGIGFVADYYYNLGSVKTMRALGKYLATRAFDESTEEGRQLKLFIEGGGQTGYSNYQELQQIREKMQGHGDWINIVEDKVLGLGGAARYMTEFSEMWTRFSIFRATLDELDGDVVTGKIDREDAIRKALSNAMNYSINMARRGAGGKAINVLNSISLFSNPAIQGASSWIRTMEGLTKDNKLWRVLWALGGSQVLLGFLSAFFNPDDDDEGYYVSDYDREHLLVFGDYRWYPNEWERPFMLIGVNAALMMRGQRDYKQATMSVMKSIVENLVPLPQTITKAGVSLFDIIEGKKSVGEMLQEFMTPDALEDIQKLSEGKNSFGQDLDSYDWKVMPQWKLDDSKGNRISKAIARWMYWGSGGPEDGHTKFKKTEDKDGKEIMTGIETYTDVSPKAIRAWANVFIPQSLQGFASCLFGLGEAALTDLPLSEAVAWNDIPLAGRFRRADSADQAAKRDYHALNDIVKGVETAGGFKYSVGNGRYNVRDLETQIKSQLENEGDVNAIAGDVNALFNSLPNGAETYIRAKEALYKYQNTDRYLNARYSLHSKDEYRKILPEDSEVAKQKQAIYEESLVEIRQLLNAIGDYRKEKGVK